MKKTIFLLIIICTFFVGCGKEKEPEVVTLNIVSDTWYQVGVGDSNTQILTVKKGDVISVNGSFQPLVFTVVEADKKKVLIKTEYPMSEDIINLNSKETKFTIKENSALVLNTLTMDAGTTYTLRITESENGEE